MSGQSASLFRRGIQLVSLLVVTAVLLGVGKIAPSSSSAAGIAAALGLLLMAGVLCSEVLDLIKLPHLTGYICAGVVAGPQVLHLIDHETVNDLSEVNALALSLIALAGGLELRISTIKEVARSLTYATLVHTFIGFLVTAGGFLLLRSWIPFTAALPLSAAIGVSMLWGVLAISRSPSATLAILAQIRPDGRLTRYALAFVMSSDIVVVLMMAACMVIARPLIVPGSSISVATLGSLGHELYGSISVGTTLGLLLALYLKFVGHRLITILVLLGIGFSAGVRYLHLEPLLTFIVAGFVVQNLSEQGDRLLAAIEHTGAIVFVVFFATAGAHLDLQLLATLWPVALSLVLIRATITIAGQWFASRLANDPPVLRRWAWSPLISQAGMTLGLSVLVERSFPTIGPPFASLVVATVAVNEIVGPVLFKFALDRLGESGKAPAGGAHV